MRDADELSFTCLQKREEEELEVEIPGRTFLDGDTLLAILLNSSAKNKL